MGLTLIDVVELIAFCKGGPISRDKIDRAMDRYWRAGVWGSIRDAVAPQRGRVGLPDLYVQNDEGKERARILFNQLRDTERLSLTEIVAEK